MNHPKEHADGEVGTFQIDYTIRDPSLAIALDFSTCDHINLAPWPRPFGSNQAVPTW